MATAPVGVPALHAASESLASGLASREVLVGRLGETELAVWRLVGSRGHLDSRLKTHVKAKVNAGLWPPIQSQMVAFADEYERSFSDATHVGVWGSLPEEGEFLAWAARRALNVPLRALDPVLLAASRVQPWTAALNNRRVLVISPFADLARDQILKRRQLFRSDFEILPHLTVVPLVPPQTQALQFSRRSWRTELEHAKRSVDCLASRVDVVLLSAGSYGMPLARHAHAHGLPVVYMGGALQLLFGIEGGRWRNSPDLVNIRGGGWITPARERAPRGARLVERGAYW